MNVLEYICLDNDSNFRSKIIFSDDEIEDIQPIITDSLLIDNNMTTSYEIVLIPIKVIRNPFIRDEKHWLVLCDYKHPTGVAHKYSVRYNLEKVVENHEDIDVSVNQQFVLFDNTSHPLGWDKKVEIYKNYTGNNKYSIFSEKIINQLIDALIYVDIHIKSLDMTRIVGKWTLSTHTKSVLETCDDLMFIRYIAQKICFNNNVKISFTPNPIESSKIYSKCEFFISTAAMRHPEKGLEEIVKTCEKLKLKHLQHFNTLFKYNSKKFTYKQNDNNASILVILGKENGGMIKDTRCSADCNPYYVMETLITTIITDFNISSMVNDLEVLKERFNYHSVIDFDSNNPRILKSNITSNNVSNGNSNRTKKIVKEKPKKETSGLGALARILKINEDSDDEENLNNNNNDAESEVITEKNRVENIIKTLKEMNISHNVLQSSNAPKSMSKNLEHQIAEEPSINMNEPQFNVGNNFNNPPPQQIMPPIINENQHILGQAPPPNSLYTLPSQI